MGCKSCKFADLVSEGDEAGFCLWRPKVRAEAYESVVMKRIKASGGGRCATYEAIPRADDPGPILEWIEQHTHT